MKRNTIKWRIFKYNIIIIMLLIVLVAIIFNVAIRMYIENDILAQLDKIASRMEDTALRKGPDLFRNPRKLPPPDIKDDRHDNNELKYYFMLDRSLREPLSVLNADYILLDEDKKRINTSPEGVATPSEELLDGITNEANRIGGFSKEAYMNFNIAGTEYIAIVKSVSEKNTFGLGWIIIFSSIEKLQQLQWMINIILFGILVFSAIIIVIFSSLISKKISEPFSSLNEHLRAIAERKFGTKILMPVDDELRDFVNNINAMSGKLELYDKAQKTFLQNASHEFRTPLMSIQSYAEGIKYNVIDKEAAVDVILDESKRMTHMVEDLLYLSRLDTIDENYHFSKLDFDEFINSCIERMNGIAIKNNIILHANHLEEKLELYADEEKLSRAFTNVISNCIRYAKCSVSISSKCYNENRIQITISDDGSGFEENELPNIFERFYKGKKGVFGLGLAISKNVIDKHGGEIKAENSTEGALFMIELPVMKQ